MKKVDAFKADTYTSEPREEPPIMDAPPIAALGEVQQNVANLVSRTMGELGQDVSNLSSAISTFPVSSFLRIAGVLAILYIGLKFAGKFGNIKEKLSHL